jgi:hypothetical protein
MSALHQRLADAVRENHPNTEQLVSLDITETGVFFVWREMVDYNIRLVINADGSISERLDQCDPTTFASLEAYGEYLRKLFAPPSK